jgi:hypothetical protein
MSCDKDIDKINKFATTTTGNGNGNGKGNWDALPYK